MVPPAGFRQAEMVPTVQVSELPAPGAPRLDRIDLVTSAPGGAVTPANTRRHYDAHTSKWIRRAAGALRQVRTCAPYERRRTEVVHGTSNG